MQIVKKLAVGTVPSRTVPNRKNSTPHRPRQQRRYHQIPRSLRSKTSKRGYRPSQSDSLAAKKSIRREIINMSSNETPTCNTVDSNAGPKYYVNAKILGESVRMLLDTGSQVSIVTEAQCSPEVFF